MSPVTNPEFTVSVELIGPEEAGAFLLKTDCNPRPVMPNVVERYARVMHDGEWHLGAGFIALCGDHGCLVQGQHTCRSIVASGATIEVVVFRGLTHEAVKALDTGKVRLYSQVLRGEGQINSIQLAAALRMLWIWERGALNDPSMVPALTELEQYRLEHPGIAESVRAVTAMSVSGLRFMASASASLHYMAGRVGLPDSRDEFFEQVRNGTNLQDGDPALALRNWLMREATSPRRAKAVVQLAVATKAWNAYVQGRKIRVLSWRRVERFPTLVGPMGVWPVDADEHPIGEEVLAEV